MVLLDTLLKLAREYEAKWGLWPTSAYIGPEYHEELTRIEIEYRFRNPLSRYCKKKLLRGKRIRAPNILGMKCMRACIKTVVENWNYPELKLQKKNQNSPRGA